MNEIIIENDKGAAVAKYTADMVRTVKDTVAKNATDSELKMFLTVASMYDLNPFKKEIWFTKFKNKKTGEWETDIMTSRDGYVKIAKQKEGFVKLQSNAVYENDEFKMEWEGMDIKNIYHSHGASDRGKVVGAWAGIRSRSGEGLLDSKTEEVYVYVPFREYNKGNQFWKYQSAMIRKVAEKEVCRLYADVSGLHIPEEMPGRRFDAPTSSGSAGDVEVNIDEELNKNIINTNKVEEEDDVVSNDDEYFNRGESTVEAEVVVEANVETFEKLIEGYKDVLESKDLPITRIRILKCLNLSETLDVDFKKAFMDYVKSNYDKNMKKI